MCLQQEWEERTEEDSRLEQQQKKDEDRKRIREEKARLARLAAIQVPASDLHLITHNHTAMKFRRLKKWSKE